MRPRLLHVVFGGDFLLPLPGRSPVTTFAQPMSLERRICLALAHIRAARYDSNPLEISVAKRQMDGLLERIACRPLCVIDPELDKHLTVQT